MRGISERDAKERQSERQLPGSLGSLAMRVPILLSLEEFRGIGLGGGRSDRAQ